MLLISVTNSFAQDSVAIKKGEPAPFSGNLVKTELLQEFFKSHQKVPLLEESIELHKQKHEIYKESLRESEKQLSRANLKANLGMIGAFALGVVLTGVAAKAAIESTR
jgi:hypothetical protein